MLVRVGFNDDCNGKKREDTLLTSNPLRTGIYRIVQQFLHCTCEVSDSLSCHDPTNRSRWDGSDETLLLSWLIHRRATRSALITLTLSTYYLNISGDGRRSVAASLQTPEL